MGKFDGVLFVSDYDDTLYNSDLTVAEADHAALRYFTREGGTFTVATGRAHRTFTPQIEKERLSFGAPVVLSNGAAIYDYAADRYVIRTKLEQETPARLTELCAAVPELGFEAYHGEDIYVHNPNEVTRIHLSRVGVPYTERPIADMPTPWNKVIFEQEYDVLERVQQYVLDRWGDSYEVIFSNRYLLEMTHKDSNKGTMVARIRDMLGIDPGHVYCIGDNLNDLPMLKLSAIPFAPGNCAQGLKDWGARVLCTCDEHAVAQAIEILDGLY